MGNVQSKEMVMAGLPENMESLYYLLQDMVEQYLMLQQLQFYKCAHVTRDNGDQDGKQYSIVVLSKMNEMKQMKELNEETTTTVSSSRNQWKYLRVYFYPSTMKIHVSITKSNKNNSAYVNIILQNRTDFCVKLVNVIEELGGEIGQDGCGNDGKNILIYDQLSKL